MGKKAPWILIVEDEEEQAKALGQNLELEGFQIQICNMTRRKF